MSLETSNSFHDEEEEAEEEAEEKERKESRYSPGHENVLQLRLSAL